LASVQFYAQPFLAYMFFRLIHSAHVPYTPIGPQDKTEFARENNVSGVASLNLTKVVHCTLQPPTDGKIWITTKSFQGLVPH